MLHEAKQEWINALRSGEYLQRRGQLCDLNGRMCALGVLIEVTQDGQWDYVPPFYKTIGGGWNYKGRDGSLVPSVLKSVGMTEEDQSEVVGLNDEKRASFLTIADWVETHL